MSTDETCRKCRARTAYEGGLCDECRGPHYFYTHDYMHRLVSEWRDEAWGRWKETGNNEHQRLWIDLNRVEAQLKRMIEDRTPGVEIEE